MELAGAFPDVVIGCVGGGSNFAGLAFPFLREKIAGREIDVLACEPAACPTLTRGLFAYDFGDTGKLTPLVAMHTLGHDFVPAPIHAGGLRYHGVAPLISQLVRDGLIRAEAYLQNDVFASARAVRRQRGHHPAPEASHAIHGAIDAAQRPTRPARSGRSLQPLRPRPLRHGRVRRLLRRQARGRRARRDEMAARCRRSKGCRSPPASPRRAVHPFGSRSFTRAGDASGQRRRSNGCVLTNLRGGNMVRMRLGFSVVLAVAVVIAAVGGDVFNAITGYYW